MNNNLILLVEDDRRLAELVKDYLEKHDFSVVIENHGNRVIRQSQNINPALIVLDIMLPGKDGLTLCQELRPDYKGPILMLTDRKSTRLNSSHVRISYAVFCLKKKKHK